VCPLTKLRLTGLISPNHALKKVIDQFVEKYINQKGEHWVPILEFCTEYTKGRDKRLKDPIDVKLEPVVEVREPVIIVPRRPETPPDDPEDPDDPDDPEEDSQTGRTLLEILQYLLNNGYNFDQIDNIPEIIANSEDSSYDHALNEAYRRLEDPEYREAQRSRIPPILPPEYQTGRSSNEIRAFLIENGYDLDIIDNIPELVANSANSFFVYALTETRFRLEDPRYREEHRSRTAEELLEYYSRRVPRNAENLRRPEAYDVAVQTANNPLYNSYGTAWKSPIGGRWFLLHR
jgi:predicted house-cleaning noncanonical NTP pyrophosphatase (MazG superfamily)